MKREAIFDRNIMAYLKGHRKAGLTVSALISFGGVCAFPRLFPLEREAIGYTNSIFSVFLFLFLFWFLEKIFREGFLEESEKGERQRGKRWFWPACFGCSFSVCMNFGASLDTGGSVPFGETGMWLAIVIWAVIFTFLTRYFWNMAGGKWKTGQRSAEKEGEGRKGRRSLLLRAGVIFLCYLPVFLAVYPGFFVYDAQDEYLQVLTRSFSTHHPLLHVLLLGGIIHLIYKLTGSYNLGIACYTVMQMAVMAFLFAWCVEKLRAEGMKRWGRILLTLYFGLFPVLVMFSLCSAKDGLFTGMLLIAVLLLRELCRDAEGFFLKKRAVFMLGVTCLLMSMLRHNGFYAFLAFIPACIIYLKKTGKRAAACFGLTILIYVLLNSVLGNVFHVEGKDNQEMLTVPISQIARVYGDVREELSPEEKEILFRYLPEEALLKYTPKVSDGVKIHFNNEAYEADRGGFLKLWLKWGIKHPFTYLNAWFMTSYGFWYPDTVIDVYRGNTVFTYTYEDSSYFGYEVEEPGTRESKIPWLDGIYRRMSLELTQQRIPVISMLFSPGFLFWALAFILGFLCDRKSWKRVVPFVLPVLVWLTVILGPTYLVRYVVFLWALAPVVLWEAFQEIWPAKV